MAKENAAAYPKEFRRTQIAITAFVLLIALVHIAQPGLAIDSTTLTLIVIAIIPWLAPFIESIKAPGGTEINFRKYLEKDEEALQTAGLLSSTPTKTFRAFGAAKGAPPPTYAFQAVTDPNLALAGLRIEIEKKLRDIADANKVQTERAGLSKLLFELSDRNILTKGEREVLLDLSATLNRATHGAEIDESAADWAMVVGPRILGALDERLKRAEK